MQGGTPSPVSHQEYQGSTGMCVCVRERERERVSACVCACIHVSVCMSTNQFPRGKWVPSDASAMAPAPPVTGLTRQHLLLLCNHIAILRNPL